MGRPCNPEARERIIKQAEHLLHLRGFRGASMDDIARHCGMTKANLFHHFGSKEELGLAVLDLKVAEFRARRVNPLCTGAHPAEAVERMFTDCATFYAGNGCRAGCFIGNIALEMSDLNETFRKRVGAFFEEWVASMASCLAKARSAGHLPSSLDPKAAAEAILALFEGAIMQARTRRDASVLLRAGKVARSILTSSTSQPRRPKTMGPKTPCGC